ncbi:DUF6527 family protein [Paucibacter sediminis]|uniref:DUF6527 family protein n=1 Tax=Paucibacter sediminis TaxID=3019553 RepID=A0AA95NDR6_9BURK|nr:DUF6527 family protein [Paucibacter sp. S2-9]WIT12264.1 DUF6527 family protein [Paucibacter sp. S2-9]
MKASAIRPEFVEFIPKLLEPGVLYVSEKYRTASHLCACGCGEKVVTPLSPADWHLSMDGGKVSLHPSIGNWNYACKSHYWIRRNAISWAGGMSKGQIERVQARDFADRASQVAQINRERDEQRAAASGGFFGRVLRTLRRLLKL